jgi:hypothetical protein
MRFAPSVRPLALVAACFLVALPSACGSDGPAAPVPASPGGASASGGDGGSRAESGGRAGQAGSNAGGAGGGAGKATGGAAGNAGVAGAGPTTDVCDTGSCLACTACINDATCQAPYQACFVGNPGCVALQQCYLGCSDAACRDACDQQADEPSRVAARAYLTCSLCDACQTACGRDPSCDP